MKRWTIRICVLLVLGAIVNVAVGWGLHAYDHVVAQRTLRMLVPGTRYVHQSPVAPTHAVENRDKISDAPIEGATAIDRERFLREIDQQLSKRIPGGTPASHEADTLALQESVASSSVFGELVSRGGHDVFAELACDEHPYFKLAGLLGIAQGWPEERCRIAVNILFALPPDEARVRGCVLRLLRGEVGTRNLFDTVIAHLENASVADIGLYRLYKVMSDLCILTWLDAWFHEQRKDPVPVSTQAFFLFLIYSERENLRQPPSQHMMDVVESYATLSGVPLMVFAAFCREDHPSRGLAVKACLELDWHGDAASRTTFREVLLREVVSKNREFIAQKVRIDSLRVDEERRTWIWQCLDGLSKSSR